MGAWHTGFARAMALGPEGVFFFLVGTAHPKETEGLHKRWCDFIEKHKAWPTDFTNDDWKDLLPLKWRHHIDSYEQELSKKSRKSCGSSGGTW